MVNQILSLHRQRCRAADRLKKFRKTINKNPLLERREKQKELVKLEREYSRIYLEFCETVQTYPASAKKALAKLKTSATV